MANPKGNPENLKPFVPGQSGNPGGKPTGARNRINAAFLEDLATDYQKVEEGRTEPNGMAAIRKCREESPVAYVKALMALQPKQVEQTMALDDITDEQLRAAVAALQSILAAQGTGSGAEAAPKPKQAH
jgi:hypothetical protein